jgi:class 3 adenylate cyclase
MPWICASHIAMEWEIPQLRQQYEFMARFRTLVRYDNRGFGMSDRDVADFSTDALARDLETVATHLALDRFQLMATGVAAPIALVYAARHPDQVSHLVLRAAFARGSDVWSEPFEDLASLADKDWDLASEAFVNATWQVDRDFSGRLAALMRQSVTPATLLLFLAAVKHWDVSAVLASIRTPTLIVNERASRYVGTAAAQTLAGAIPGARLLLVEGSSDTGAQVAAFLSNEGDRRVERPGTGAAEPRPERAMSFRTILFTDLVEHTVMMQRLGDEAGRAVLREHERITRDVLSQHGGAEVKTDGDSFMAAFSSATSAVACAIDLQRAFAARNETADEPVIIRAGLNVGEPIEERGDYFGSAVILAARIKDQAGAGEILVPEAVRHLLSGKNFVYRDRGDMLLKGFEDAVRLFEVRWRD